jgi:hypothetical protein
MKNLILFENYFSKDPYPITRNELESIISKSGKTPFIFAVDESIDPYLITQEDWKFPGSVSMASVNQFSKILNKEIVMSPRGYTVREKPIVVIVSKRDLSRLPESIISRSYNFIIDGNIYGVITNGIDYYELR